MRTLARTCAFVALITASTITIADATPRPEPAAVVYAHKSPQKAALEWIAALWAYLGYDPAYRTPDGNVCPWGPAIQRSFDGSGLDGRYMTSIAWRESRCQPGAVSPTNDHGLLQINGINFPYLRVAGCTDIYAPNCNAVVGVRLAQAAQRMWGDPYRPWKATR